MGEDRDRDRDRVGKPAFVPARWDYGEAREVNMSKAEGERHAVGLTPKEVREINRPKSIQGDPLNKVNKVANVLAAGLMATST